MYIIFILLKRYNTSVIYYYINVYTYLYIYIHGKLNMYAFVCMCVGRIERRGRRRFARRGVYVVSFDIYMYIYTF